MRQKANEEKKKKEKRKKKTEKRKQKSVTKKLIDFGKLLSSVQTNQYNK